MPQFITLPPRSNPLGDAFGAFGAGVSKGMSGELDRKQKMADLIAAENRAKAARQAEIESERLFQTTRDINNAQANEDLQDAMARRQQETHKANREFDLESDRKSLQSDVEMFAGPRRQLILPPQDEPLTYASAFGNQFSPDVSPEDKETEQDQLFRAMDAARSRGAKKLGNIELQALSGVKLTDIKTPEARAFAAKTGDFEGALALDAQLSTNRYNEGRDIQLGNLDTRRVYNQIALADRLDKAITENDIAQINNQLKASGADAPDFWDNIGAALGFDKATSLKRKYEATQNAAREAQAVREARGQSLRNLASGAALPPPVQAPAGQSSGVADGGVYEVLDSKGIKRVARIVRGQYIDQRTGEVIQ